MKLGCVIVALALCACAPDFTSSSRVLGKDLPKQAEPVLDRQHSYYANDLARPHRDWSLLIYPNGLHVQHGRDTSWFANGKLEWEREFDHGEPTGRWRSWYENGAPRSEATFGNAELAPMRWWYANGQLSSEGPALSGTRDGSWTEWREDGTRSAQGTYRLGKKDGVWTFWNEDGSVKESVLFRDDLRIGPAPPSSSNQ